MTVKGGAIVLGAAFALVGLGSGLRTAHAAQLTKAEQARVLKQGELSGLAEACGLDWEALSFRPMMAYWRRIGKSEDQMALIGILHGVGQGTAATKPGACTDTMRRKIKAQLPFKG